MFTCKVDLFPHGFEKGFNCGFHLGYKFFVHWVTKGVSASDKGLKREKRGIGK